MVVAMTQAGAAEVVVARACSLGSLPPEAARLGAHAAFPPHEDAVARGVTREVLVSDGVVSVVDRAPSSELAFVLFALGAAPRVPLTPPALAAARLRAGAARPSGTPTSPSDTASDSDDAVRAAAEALRAAGAAWIVVGDAEITRVVAMVERHVPEGAPPTRATSPAQRPVTRSKRAARRSGVTWIAEGAGVGDDPGVDLAWFTLAGRLGASPGVAGPPDSRRAMSLAGDPRELEARFARVHAALSREGVTADEIATYRLTREAEALSRDLPEWAARLALHELRDGDARRAGRELAAVWELGIEGSRRALAGPLAPGRVSVVVAEVPK